MKKFFIQKQLETFSKFKTTSLTAQEDLDLYRLIKLMSKSFEELNKERGELIDNTKGQGINFLEDGQVDIKTSDAEVLKKTEEKIALLMNEELDTHLLSIALLNKLKIENEILSGKYNFLLEMYLKEEREM